MPGAAPDHADYGSFVSFSDPDGNGWLLQEIKTRLPGRVTRATRRRTTSASDLAERPAAGGRRRTASTRSGPARRTRTGRTGTPRTWSRERAGEELPT